MGWAMLKRTGRSHEKCPAPMRPRTTDNWVDDQAVTAMVASTVVGRHEGGTSVVREGCDERLSVVEWVTELTKWGWRGCDLRLGPSALGLKPVCVHSLGRRKHVN